MVKKNPNCFGSSCSFLSLICHSARYMHVCVGRMRLRLRGLALLSSKAHNLQLVLKSCGTCEWWKDVGPTGSWTVTTGSVSPSLSTRYARAHSLWVRHGEERVSFFVFRTFFHPFLNTIDAPFFWQDLWTTSSLCLCLPSLACRPGSPRASFLPSFLLRVCDFAKRTRVEMGWATEAELNKLWVWKHTHTQGELFGEEGWGSVGFYYTLHLGFHFTVKLV